MLSRVPKSGGMSLLMWTCISKSITCESKNNPPFWSILTMLLYGENLGSSLEYLKEELVWPLRGLRINTTATSHYGLIRGQLGWRPVDRCWPPVSLLVLDGNSGVLIKTMSCQLCSCKSSRSGKRHSVDWGLVWFPGQHGFGPGHGQCKLPNESNPTRPTVVSMCFTS